MTADSASIAAGLTDGQAAALREPVLVCEYAGTWVASHDARILGALQDLGLLDLSPAFAGSPNWIVAPLNDHGLAVRAALTS